MTDTTTTTTTDDEFVSGAEAFEEYAKSAGAGFARTQFLSLKDGEKVVLRFLTDASPLRDAEGNVIQPGWIAVAQHQMVPTRSAPEDYGDNWPKSMSAVCRKSKKANGQPFFDECYIDDHMTTPKGGHYKASVRGWALACVREAVYATCELVTPSEQGPAVRVGMFETVEKAQAAKADAAQVIQGLEKPILMGYRDKKRTITRKDGEAETSEEVKDVVIVNLSWKNFFSKLEFYARNYDTVLDRDYLVERKGAMLATDYNVMNMDPIDFRDSQGNVQRYDVRHPEVMAKYPMNEIDLREIVKERMSEEFYDRFFDERHPQPERSGGGEDAKGSEKPVTDVSQPALDALRDRVLQYGTQTTGNQTVTTNVGVQPAQPSAPSGDPVSQSVDASGPVALDE